MASKYFILLYGEPSLWQIPVLWLVLSRSGFCSRDRFHGNGPFCVFLFWSETGKLKIYNENSEKKNCENIVILHSENTRRKLKRLKLFRHFKDGWRRRTFCKRVLLSWRSGNFWCRNWNRHHRVPYNKQLTNRACSGRTGEYWPSVVAVRTSHISEPIKQDKFSDKIK